MDTRDQTLTKLTRLHGKSHPTHHLSKPMMQLLTHGGEHHEIGGGGRLMMMMATNSPLWTPERTPDLPTRERLGLGGGFVT